MILLHFRVSLLPDLTMYSQAILLSILVALGEARFGQEQLPIAAISESAGGNAGDAATLAGSAVSTLLGGANPCDKVGSYPSNINGFC